MLKLRIMMKDGKVFTFSSHVQYRFQTNHQCKETPSERFITRRKHNIHIFEEGKEIFTMPVKRIESLTFN